MLKPLSRWAASGRIIPVRRADQVHIIEDFLQSADSALVPATTTVTNAVKTAHL